MVLMARINIVTPVYFSCKESCSACCEINGGLVVVNEQEIKAISSHLKLSEKKFLARYTVQNGKHTCLIDRDERACIFLEDNKCQIYPVRPFQCKTFPFWPQNVKSEKRWATIMEECPGIGEGKPYSHEEIEKVFKGAPVDSDK